MSAVPWRTKAAEPAGGERHDPQPHRLRDRRARHIPRLGWGDFATIALAVALAFFFGYLLTSLPLLRSGLLREVVPIALTADTISIAIMEIVDNGVLLLYPGAMEAGLTDVLSGGASRSHSRWRGWSRSRSTAG